MAAESVHAGFGVDTREFATLAKALRRAAPEIHKHLMLNLRSVGEVVAGAGRSEAAAVSESVPSSIKVRVSGATVSVVAGGGNVVMAGLLEIGNKGRPAASFRHPVFGNASVWVEQPTHPFLKPAVLAAAPFIEKATLGALDAAVTELGA